MVDFRITYTLSTCRKELRFQTLSALGRDLEIPPTAKSRDSEKIRINGMNALWAFKSTV